MGAAVTSALLQAAALVALVLACAIPLSGYLVNVMEGRLTPARHVLGPVERAACRLMGVRGEDPMGWKRFLVSALLFTAVCFAGLMAILMGQGALPLSLIHISEPTRPY